MDGAASFLRLWRRRTRRSLPEEEEDPVESELSKEEEDEGLADGAMARGARRRRRWGRGKEEVFDESHLT